MPQISEAQLKQEIKSGTLSNLYFLYGEEGYLKQFYANALVKAAVQKGMEAFNLKKFDGDDGVDISAVLEAAETLPAFGPYMCVLVHDYPLDTLAQEEQKRLEAFLQDIPQSTVLIFWQDSAKVQVKKNAKWKSLVQKMGKLGTAVQLDPRALSDVFRLLQNGAKKRGCTLERKEAQYLLECVGNNLSLLLNELEKICNYKQAGTITKEDIDKLATKSLEANVFDLSRALHAGNCTRALQILEKLLADKEPPELILGTLVSAYVDLYRVKIALEAGRKPMDLTEYFSYRNTAFRLQNAAGEAKRMRLTTICACLSDLHAADMALKSGVEEPKLVLQKLIVRLSAAKGMC